MVLAPRKVFALLDFHIGRVIENLCLEFSCLLPFKESLNNRIAIESFLLRLNLSQNLEFLLLEIIGSVELTRLYLFYSASYGTLIN